MIFIKSLILLNRPKASEVEPAQDNDDVSNEEPIEQKYVFVYMFIYVLIILFVFF